eukprot:Lithocolla_globosa_v1_NODE_4446_length_1432_cov_14.986202.p1 type:complete len:414 gc:universal NODE_4446_length_1432_cov_14.986202:87-1328(+)
MYARRLLTRSLPAMSSPRLGCPVARTYSTGLNSLYTLTESEQMLKAHVARFAREQIEPKVAEMDEAQKMNPEILKGLFEQGLMGIETPEELSGTGMGFMEAILMIEELAKIDPSISVLADVQNTLVGTLFLKYGNKDVQSRYLPQLATNKVGCFCLSEPGSGTDAFALRTKAVDNGDHYEITGEKCWITNSGEAEIFLVFANLDFSKGYKGITCFIVDKEMGVKVGKKENKLGIRASSTCTVNFDSVKVPKENVLGEIGKGYKYAIEILNEGRIGIAAQMLGCAQGTFDVTMPYLFERKQFNTRIGDFQGMQHQYARLAMQIEATRLMVYNAARLKDEGQNFVKQAAMAKLYASQTAEQVSSLCIELCGGVGFTKDYRQEKFFRDSKIGSIYEGTSNIQLQTIAKFVTQEYQK